MATIWNSIRIVCAGQVGVLNIYQLRHQVSASSWPGQDVSPRSVACPARGAGVNFRFVDEERYLEKCSLHHVNLGHRKLFMTAKPFKTAASP